MADDKLVTVATFSYAVEAHLSKAKLESAGMRSFVAENFAPNWGITVGAGGVKLQVKESDAQRTTDILNSQKKK